MDLGHSDEYAIFTASVGFVSCGLIGVIVAIQARHTWYDLAPENDEDRKSIQHRRKKPKRTREYKRIVYATLISMIFSLLCTIAQVLSQSVSMSWLSCRVYINLSSWLIAATKLSMYGTFFMRLRECYKELPDSLGWYTVKRLQIIFGVGCVGFTFSMVMTSAFMSLDPDDEFDPITATFEMTRVDDFPYSCLGRTPGIVPALVYLFADTTLALLNLWLFRKPLKKAVQGINENYKDELTMAEKLNVKLLAVQKRTQVLVYVAIITNFIYLFLGGMLSLWFVFYVDQVITCVAIAFMQGAYYDDHTNKCYSYRKLCWMCAKCCDSKGHSIEYPSSRKPQGDKHAVAPSGVSADTLTAHMHIAPGQNSLLQNSTTVSEVAKELATAGTAAPMTPVAEEDVTPKQAQAQEEEQA